jgi:hypothetical protein
MQKFNTAESPPQRLTQGLRPSNATVPRITPQARHYAVKELARRAGVTREFFQTWQIEVRTDRTSVSLGPETKRTIHFQHAEETSCTDIACGSISVARAAWLNAPHDSLAQPDLVLPFCNSNLNPGRRAPLYQQTSDDTIVCRLDLLSSFLFTLSRLEETLFKTVDEHGRFPASASLALRHEYLDRPILDEHGLAFRQVLSSLLPAWRPQPRILRFKLTHDIDDIGIPFEFRASIGHSLKRQRPFATLRDFLALSTAVEPAELALIRRLAAISEARGLHSAFYWKASPRGPYDSGYDPAQKKVRRVIDFLRERGFEMGVHPGYQTFGDRLALSSEVARLRETLGVTSPGGRQHYLRWSPETWLDWEACGLSYDSSLGFADQFGFRAGTAFPYRPWCLRDNRELHLIELPLILMDCTPVKYMNLDQAEGLERIKVLVQRTAQTGGVFTLLWHNTPLLEPAYDGWYEPILDLLVGAQSYSVPANAELLW